MLSAIEIRRLFSNTPWRDAEKVRFYPFSPTDDVHSHIMGNNEEDGGDFLFRQGEQSSDSADIRDIHIDLDGAW